MGREPVQLHGEGRDHQAMEDGVGIHEQTAEHRSDRRNREQADEDAAGPVGSGPCCGSDRQSISLNRSGAAPAMAPPASCSAPRGY